MLAASICSASMDVGNPTSASASDTALFHLWCFENRICGVTDLIINLIRDEIGRKYLVVCNMVSCRRVPRGYQGFLAQSESLQGSFGEHFDSLSLPRLVCALMHLTSYTSSLHCVRYRVMVERLGRRRSGLIMTRLVAPSAVSSPVATGDKKRAVDFAGQVKGQLQVVRSWSAR